MLVRLFLGFCMFYVCVHGQFPWNMVGFNPASFSAQLQSQLQDMSAGLQNMGANIQAMTQNSIRQAQASFQSALADRIRRAQEEGTTFDFTDLRPGEFRQFVDRRGVTRGFSRRSADGLTSTFCLFADGLGSNNYLFSDGPHGHRVMTF